MAKIVLFYPNKWGRGITPLWVASHTSMLRAEGHEVLLFDCTFYADWTMNENKYNTENKQYQPTEYDSFIQFTSNDVREDLQSFLELHKPDIVFWSAITSHIHGEGEYVAIQHGHELISAVKNSAILVAGGLQATADPVGTFRRFPHIDFLILGESEKVLVQIAEQCPEPNRNSIKGLAFKDENGEVIVNTPQELICNMDDIPPYDYSLLADQVFFRPYNGKVVRAVDYELSRGCIYSCSYCVETVIQRYYGFTESMKRGVIKNAKKYLRNKSASRIFAEIESLSKKQRIYLFRCQDTNFLTIDNQTLSDLADMFDDSDLPIIVYIETRPESITPKNVTLLKRLRVDGVGMGIELSTQDFRENYLNRFADQKKIINAFKLLREAGIKRTTYNIIGLPAQSEDSIIQTILFNRLLAPDNITVAFYSPFIGTQQQKAAISQNYFSDYEYSIDSQLRTVSKHQFASQRILEFYKSNFVKLAREGIDNLEKMKEEFFNNRSI